MSTDFVAGDASNQATFTGGNDGAFKFRTGPAGAKVDAMILDSAGQVSFPQGAAGITQIFSLTASVATNAMTISTGALAIDFRSATLSSGTVTRVSGTPSNLVIPSTATLGTLNNVLSRLMVLAINNGGTIELAVVNVAGGVNLDETGVISTTAIAAASNSATIVYATSARTNVAYRVIGAIESTQTTAGTWASAPSLVQGAGGNALDSMGSIGYGQTWQNFTIGTQRVVGTVYYNTTGKPIQVALQLNQNADAAVYLTLRINGTIDISGGYGRSGAGDNGYDNAVAIIPPGSSYQALGNVQSWYELR